MKTIALAAGLLASAALLTGCGLADLAQPGTSESASYQVTEKVTKLQLRSNSGDAVITETGGTAVRVVETLHWRGEGSKPKPEHKVEGETLLMSYTCPSDWGGGCSVDYKIEIPKGLSVDLETGSGNLTLRNLTGPIDVNAGSGDVDAAGLAGKQVFAETGSGNLELKYVTAPDSAELEAGSGDITLSVPDGAYDVKSEVGSGDTAVTVKNDTSSAHKISLTAGSGNITVKPA
ncbi:DUF4097 family beta strand repeat-containing protein [Nonomuraea rubra]|uniref:DUF4097 domain-containing protein n=1 Tax=Nonomuraea rubra TaxID=46180 RepID=A0A7X0P393_9ACTN|nr:DUF4097 family beta strand repeat-containing protein [Nonomuraea rubra]MBB6554377.1 hypothetical protein [Nonomuraea rubra]